MGAESSSCLIKSVKAPPTSPHEHPAEPRRRLPASIRSLKRYKNAPKCLAPRFGPLMARVYRKGQCFVCNVPKTSERTRTKCERASREAGARLQRDPQTGSAGNTAHTCAGRCNENGCLLGGGVQPLIATEGGRRAGQQRSGMERVITKEDEEARRNKSTGGV